MSMSEAEKREEERLLRAMQKKSSFNARPVFSKQVSTDQVKKQKEEEEKKKKQEEEKKKKLEDDRKKREQIEADRKAAEKAAADQRAVEQRAAQRASEQRATEQHVSEAHGEVDEKALSREEQRMKSLFAAAEPKIQHQPQPQVQAQAQPQPQAKGTSLQEHLRHLQEKSAAIEQEEPTLVYSAKAPSGAPIQSAPEPVHHTPAPAPAPVHHTPAPAPEPVRHTPAPAPAPAPSHNNHPAITIEKAQQERPDFPAPGPASILGAFEREILDEINSIRANPQRYANYLRTLENNFNDNIFSVPGSKFVRQTKEGFAAIQNAIAFLESHPPVGPLQLSELLSKVSKDLAEEEGSKPRGSAGGPQAYDRFSRYGKWEGEMAEMISFGGINPKEIVLQWMVDDGDHERRDRQSALKAQFETIGISTGHHQEYGRICVATLTHKYYDINEQPKQASVAAAANVSLIKEEDGRVVISGGPAPGDKSKFRLIKRGRRLTLLSSDVNRSWDLPFEFKASNVKASIQNETLAIEILKTVEAEEGDSGVHLVSSFSIPPSSGATAKIHLAVRQDAETIYVDIFPSSFEEELVIKTRGNSVEVESKHIEIEEQADQTFKKAITSVQTLQLPFKPTDLNVEHKVSGKPCIIINKKVAQTPRANDQEEDIVIH